MTNNELKTDNVNKDLYKRFIYSMPIILFLGVCSSSYAYVSILLKIATQTHNDYHQILFMPLSYAIFTAVIGLFMGVISDKYARKPVILISLVISCFASLGLLFFHDILSMIIFAGMQGFATASLSVILRLVIKDNLNKDKQLAINSYLLAGVTVAPVAAPIIGAFLFHVTNYFQIVFIFTFITAICALIISFIIIPSSKAKHPDVNILKHSFSGIREIIMHNKLQVLMALVVLSFCSLNLFIISVPYIMQNTLGLPAIDSSYFFIALGVGYFIGIPITNHLKKISLSFYFLIGLGLTVMIVGLLSLQFISIIIQNKIIFLVLICIISALYRVGQAIFLGSSLVQIMHEIQHYDSLSAGVSCSMIYVGAFIGIGISASFSKNYIQGFLISQLCISILMLILFCIFIYRLKNKSKRV